jgi:hypothetical protein
MSGDIPQSPYPPGFDVHVIGLGKAQEAFRLAVNEAYAALSKVEAFGDALARVLDEGRNKGATP